MNETLSKQLAGEALFVQGWTLAKTGWVRHPADEERGILVRYDHTGRYCLALGGTLRNCPQRWAKEQAADSDANQEE